MNQKVEMSVEEARRILATVFLEEEVMSYHQQKILTICHMHPALALERFLRKGKLLTSFGLLLEVLEETSDLNFVKSFCEAFPDALAFKDEETGFLPLHKACSMSQPVRGLIAWLARQYPLAVLQKSSRGDLPLHILFSSRSDQRAAGAAAPTLSRGDVEALVEIYPESTVITSVDRRTTPADTVLEDLSISQEIREYICSNVPRCVRFFQLRASASPSNQAVAMGLAKMLPQLTILECKRTEWETAEGWITLLNALESNTSIRNLSLMLPQNLPFEGYSDALASMVRGNNTISKLGLFDYAWMTPIQHFECMDLTKIMVYLLEHNVIQSLALVGVHLDIDALRDALTRNTSLTEWNVEYSPTVCWDKLAVVLRLHNTSLKKILVPSRKCPASVRKDILYHSALNRFGRRYFRRESKTTLMDVLSLLASFGRQKYVIQQGTRIEMYQLRYGLLREAPALWCHGYC